MTVLELHEISHSPLKVKSSFNGKILCHRFNKNKHQEIGAREVMSLWSEIAISDHNLSSFATGIICVYADGRKEAAKHFGFTEVKTDG